MIEVVIPAYNCTDTLNKALASLEAQIDTNFIVTIVDDCSELDIKSIIDRYAATLCIKYIRNVNNLGCGMSRQVGIDASTSEYIMFLDSDDILMPYTIKLLYDAIDKSPDTDVFVGQFYMYKNNKLITNCDKTHCHAKLYNRNFIQQYDISASPDILYADDSYFNSQCFELASKITQLPYPLYVWIRNQASITYSEGYNAHNISDFIHAMNLSIVKISKYKDIKDITFIDDVLNNINYLCVQNLQHISASERQNIRSEIKVLEKLISRKIDIVV